MSLDPTNALRRVAVVGGGAAGVAAAWTLAQSPDVQVTLFESAPRLGGVAFSETFSGIEVNVGVQGAAPSYANTLKLHRLFGFSHTRVRMTTSFGRSDDRWTNKDAQPAPILQRHHAEIARFGPVLKLVNALRALFAGVTITGVLRTFGFSDEFAYDIVYPLTALFFGTGNQTARTSSALVARVFFDPDFRLFEYDSRRFAYQPPEMIAFDPLSRVFGAAEGQLRRLGVRLKLGAPVTRVTRGKDGVVVHVPGSSTRHDAVVFACPADVCLRVLGDGANETEREVLGAVQYYTDLTVTHTDAAYAERLFDTTDCAYGVRHSDPRDPSKFEMFFNLSLYQHTPQPVFQTIFLNEEDKETWSVSQIDPSRVVFKNEWRQFAHTTEHYMRVVRRVKHLNNARRDTLFCGAWVLANTHEMATTSGMCAAVRLGAPRSFADDERCTQTFRKIMNICYA